MSAVIVTAQQTIGHAQSNNFQIFRESFAHLVRGVNLYGKFPTSQFDLFKYSPTFALLFAPFALVPYSVGLLLWNLTNAAALCIAMVLLLTPRAAAWALGIVFLEALGAMQNSQSNGLCAALMILALVALEREHVAWGAAAVASGAAIKVYPLASGLLGLVSPKRWSHLLWCIAMGALCLSLPLLVTSPTTLLGQYHAWFALQRADTTKIEMYWVGGVLERVTGNSVPHVPLQLLGVLWTITVAWRARLHWSDPVLRRLLVAALLLFAVVFNHMSESPTFVIAFAGVGIWWSVLPRARWRDAVVLLVVLIGSVGGSDAVPNHIRLAWIVEPRLKAWVTIFAWCALQYDMLRLLRPVSPLPVALAPLLRERTRLR